MSVSTVQADSASGFSPSPLPPLVTRLAEFFSSAGVSSYLVGGVVRDALLGRPTRDVDVAIEGDPQGIANSLASSLGGRVVVLDEKRSIVRVVFLGDLDISGSVDITPVNGGILKDLERRDFALDAMAVPLAEAAGGEPWGDIIDPGGGLSDLRTGVIRAVDSEVFKADPARLFRAARLASQLEFEIHEDTARQIRRDAHLVTTVAPERIRNELLKLLSEPKATLSLRRLDDLNLLCPVIPELEEARGVTQPKEHYWDVFDHLLETAGQVEMVVRDEPDGDGFVADSVPSFGSMTEHFAGEISDGQTRLALLKLSGLLHDIAKPASKTVESSGRIRFFGHHTEGAEVAARILRRLRVSGRGVELVRLVVEHHLRPSQMAQKGELPTGRAIFRYFRDVGDAAIDTLYLNMADYLAARGPYLAQDEWSEHCRIVGHILRQGLEASAPERRPRLLDGHDIMETFGLSPGPSIGILINVVDEAQAGEEIATREEALALVEQSLNSEDRDA